MKLIHNSIGIKHILFTICSNEQLKESNNIPYVHIFSKKIGNRIYKKKYNHIGYIIKINSKNWCFKPDDDLKNTISYESLILIAAFMNALNDKTVKYDFKENVWITKDKSIPSLKKEVY